MTNLNYRTWDFTKSRMFKNRSNPGVTYSFGFWLRKTTDRVLPVSLSGAPASYEDLYKPLQEGQIRVLTLLPGKGSEPLAGSLTIVPLKDTAAREGFQALSYLWGLSASGESCIDLQTGHMGIRENLTRALAHIRHPTVAQRLWIDAICMNQEDLVERSHQVQLMANIYASAQRVLIWLGPSSAQSSYGMDILRQLSSTTRFPWGLLSFPGTSLIEPGLADIMSRGYFQRYWVVQEATLARAVVMMCGSDEVCWSTRCADVVVFLRNVKLMVLLLSWRRQARRTVSEEDSPPVGMENLVELLQVQLDSGSAASIWNQRRRIPDLLDLAYAMRNRQATDLRDRIYSLIGMAGLTVTDSIVPDYHKSAEEVFDDFVKAVNTQTEAICTEIESLEQTTKQETPPKIVDDPHIPQNIGDNAVALDGFIENTSTQAIVEVRNHNPRKAAQLLQSAATLLRGESFRGMTE